ncbi:MAG: hypothetical protein HY929_07345 [Euryarchaeota archaeon]|nr:hypothetical protein [Euryarchaeota archaeon]
MITVGFSPHWIEALEHMEKEMKKHDVIVLEEPQNLAFENMLKEKISTDEYLGYLFNDTYNLSPAFPRFAREMCEILRKLYKEGKIIDQEDPYYLVLEGIYRTIDTRKENSSSGEIIQEILRDPQMKKVYLSESRAQGFLLNYYNKVLSGSFNDVVKNVKEFAKADAERIKLRLKMRAESISNKIKKGKYKGSIYVEAGGIHLPLLLYLRENLGDAFKIKPIFLLEEPTREMTAGRFRHILPPGDVLTLRYMWGKINEERDDLLAARSIIRIMLLERWKEKAPSQLKFPHLKEETKLIKSVGKLSLKDCENLFKQIRK